MSITIAVHANDDDALISWRFDPWPDGCKGFLVEKRNVKTGEVSVLNNRIPPEDGGTVPVEGIGSDVSPLLRCIWTDHEVDDRDDVQYRVTPVLATGNADPSDWTKPLTIEGNAGDGLSVHFNRGTLMSQVVSRMLGEKPTSAVLKKFKGQLASPGFPPRRYLSGQARHTILTFLADADQRGNDVYAAIYEFNDEELIAALKAFGARGHVLLGNGSGLKEGLADEFRAAGLEVHGRDLSHGHGSSPSVHNKFVVEYRPSTKRATRVLTGSTNWTVTGLCTQLNNVLVIKRQTTAKRYLDQWHALVAAGNDLPDALKAKNAVWKDDGPVHTVFAATPGQQEFAPIVDLIRNAKDGLLFLMFMPGQSPLLAELLQRSEGEEGPYVRGAVSSVTESANGDITKHEGRVIRRGHTENYVRDSTLLPASVPANNAPSWELAEFTQKMFLDAGLMAIVHSKVIVVDPFSDGCAVITGSHNFSPSASKSNDENLVLVRGNKALAQAYAVHIEGVYDHYAWRAFLEHGGKPSNLFKSLNDWKPGARRDRDVKFWTR